MSVDYYTTSGVYYDTLPSVSGCDSIIITDLIVMNYTILNQAISICYGDTFNVGQQLYYSTGLYIDTIIGSNGFDTIIETDLEVIPAQYLSNNVSICSGDTLNLGNSVYYTPGIYLDTLQSINGCDSIIETYLSVLPLYVVNQSITICNGDSIQVYENYYSVTGMYSDTISSPLLCDTIINTELNVSDPQGTMNLNGNLLIASGLGGIQPYYYEIGNEFGVIVYSNNNSGNTITFPPTVNGTYYFIITDESGCTSDTVFVDVSFHTTNNIDEYYINNLEVFPNPSRDIFNIKFTSHQVQNLKVRVINIIGEELVSDNLQQFIGEYTKQIDLKDNAKGIYFLEIKTNNGIINKKLILQ